MTRTIAAILAFILCTIPASAAKHVSVAELEKALAEIHNKSDADQAWQIASLELTERLTADSLSRLQNSLPGEKSKQALLALADQSAFLDPPAAELPPRPTPDLAEQRRIMGLAVAYVRGAIPRLPNFFATRTTNRYEETPQFESMMGVVPYQPMHFTDRAESTVLYRNGREVVETAADRGRHPTMPLGLTTWGVFGPILSSVLLDAAHSKLAWNHWEQGAAGLEAVFSFAVQKEQSHYEVNYCCIAHQAATRVANEQPFRQLVGYLGEIAVDPQTGTVLRIAVVAELKPTDPVVKAAIVVEYGPVEIAGKIYICPTRSVSDTVAQSTQHDPRYSFALARQIQPLVTSVNEVAFGNYHVFRSDARVLTPEEAALAQAAAAPPAPAPVAGRPAPADGQSTAAETPSQTLAATSPSTLAPEPNAPVEPIAPEIEIAAGAVLPDAPMNSPKAASSQFTVRTTTRLVDLALIAEDKKGRPVIDLKPEDLEIYDDGRKQAIKYFSHAGAKARSAATKPAEPAEAGEPASFTNRASAAAPSAPTESSTILMIDAGHVAFSDLTYAREEILRFLSTVPPDEEAGLYILRSYGYQVLTEPTLDHARLASLLKNWMPNAQDLARAQEEEQRNRQHFDWVHSENDLAFVNGNGAGGSDPETYSSGTSAAAAAASPPDPQLRPMGDRPEDFALHLLVGVGRHLASIPGHKILVWISSDNVLADFSGQAVGHGDTGSTDTHFLDPTSLHAKETLNEAHVSIYPVDVSQLEAGGIGADIGTRNVLAVGKTDRDSSLAGMGDAFPGMKPGRATAQMQQDTHPIQGAFRDLAAATGGRAFRRAGDIAGELDNVVADGRAAYLLSFSPDVPADDKYHVITVKIAGGRQLDLRYRNGYFYAKEPETLKDHFRKLVWDARDAQEIGLTATPALDAKGTLIQLRIDATQLSLAETAGRWTDRLGVFLALRDDSGLHAKVVGRSLMLRLLPGTYQQVLKDGIPFEQPIDTNSAFDSARFIVVDENSGRIGSVTVPVRALKPAS